MMDDQPGETLVLNGISIKWFDIFFPVPHKNIPGILSRSSFMASRKLLNKTVCVVGLGSVGLPLAQAFAEHLRTIGYRRD